MVDINHSMSGFTGFCTGVDLFLDVTDITDRTVVEGEWNAWLTFTDRVKVVFEPLVHSV